MVRRRKRCECVSSVVWSLCLRGVALPRFPSSASGVACVALPSHLRCLGRRPGLVVRRHVRRKAWAFSSAFSYALYLRGWGFAPPTVEYVRVLRAMRCRVRVVGCVRVCV